MISVREIQQSDIEPLLDYWFTASDEFLIGMGVDLSKMPKRDEFKKMLETQLTQLYNEKQSYCTIWLMADKPIGHCNVGKITYGEEAYMHLHMWRSDIRQKGLGHFLIKQSIPFFFENLKLKNLYCEPYALNPSPNKALPKVGFEFVKEYITIPGIINSEQPVKRWVMTYDMYKKLGLSWAPNQEEWLRVFHEIEKLYRAIGENVNSSFPGEVRYFISKQIDRTKYTFVITVEIIIISRINKSEIVGICFSTDTSSFTYQDDYKQPHYTTELSYLNGNEIDSIDVGTVNPTDKEATNDFLIKVKAFIDKQAENIDSLIKELMKAPL